MGLKIARIDIKLEGVAPIIFDKFYGHNAKGTQPEAKFYLEAGNQIVLPAGNIMSFLSCQQPKGCACKFEGRSGKDYALAVESYISIRPAVIPFVDDKDELIHFTEFDGVRFDVNKENPRTKGTGTSIKQENTGRPVMYLPWGLGFTLSLIENDKIDENRLYNWFNKGGFEVGLCNYRPRHGRFAVTKWEIQED